MPKTFFSYSRSDADFTRKLATDLRTAGADLWIDQLDIQPGVRWDDAIESALRESETLLVILSPKAVASQNIMDEVSYALENNKKVIPVVMEQCELPFRLKRLQYISFVEGYNEGFQRLCGVLGLNAASPETNRPATLQQTIESKSQPTLKNKAAGSISDGGDGIKKDGKPLMKPAIIGAGVVILLLILYFVFRASPQKEEVTSDNTATETGQAEETASELVAGVYISQPAGGTISLFRFYPRINIIVYEHGIDTTEEAINNALSELKKETYTEYQYTVDGKAISFDANITDANGVQSQNHFKGTFESLDSTMELVWSGEVPETGLVSYDLRWISPGD
jgi:hypothetical protein